jgi:hypothetical protein
MAIGARLALGIILPKHYPTYYPTITPRQAIANLLLFNYLSTIRIVIISLWVAWVVWVVGKTYPLVQALQ